MSMSIHGDCGTQWILFSFTIALHTTLAYNNKASAKFSSEVDNFLNIFNQCVIRFNTIDEFSQESYTETYNLIRDFYLGYSPFLLQDVVVYNRFNYSEDLGNPYKYTTCVVNIHLTLDIPIFYTHNRLKATYIFLLFSQKYFDPNLISEAEVIEPLTHLLYPAIVFALFERRTVRIICISCNPSNIFHPIHNCKNFNCIQLKSARLHSTLNELPVKTGLEDLKVDPRQREDCSISHSNTDNKVICVHILLAKHLNYTAFSSSDSESWNTHVFHAYIEDSLILSESNLKMFLPEFTFLSYPLDESPFTIMVVLKNVPFNMLAIIQPFGKYVWLGILITVSSLVIIFYLHFGRKNLHQLWNAVTNLLLDQPVEVSTVFGRNKSSHSLMFTTWCVWCVMSLVFNQAYKGVLFSFMSTAPTIKIPTSLSSIISQKSYIATTSTIIAINGSGLLETVSMLEESILEKRKDGSSNSNQLYEKLLQKLTWLGDDNINRLVQSVRNKSYSINITTPDKPHKITKLPSYWVLIDPEPTVKIIKKLLEYFTNVWTSPVLPLNVFMSRAFWVMTENYFYPIFKKSLAQIVESGFYMRWQEIDRTQFLMRNIKELNKRFEAKESESLEKSKKLLHLGSGTFHLIFGHKVDDSENNVPTLGISNEVQTFFQNFYHCLFQFHIGNSWELSDDWDSYESILKFYAGESPFTIQNNTVTNLIHKYNRRRRRWRTLRKFSNCSVQLHLSRQLKTISETEDVRRRPEFMWFLFFSNETSECDDTNMKNSEIKNSIELANLGYPSIFFMIYDLTYVKMLCLSCVQDNRETDLQQLALNDLQSYKNLWENLHSKLDRTPIKINLNLMMSNTYTLGVKRWDCNIHKGYVITSSACTYLIIRKALNFSTIHNRSPLLERIVTHGSIYTGMIVTESNLDWITNRKFQMLSYAITAEPYGYIMVLDHAPSNLKAIIQPFDWKIWINLGVATSLLTFILSLEFENGSRSAGIKTNYFHNDKVNMVATSRVWFSIMVALLDQPTSVISTYSKRNSSTVMLWTLWCLVALSVSQSYKGALFSFLSSSPIPWIPDTLGRILDSNMPLITQVSMIVTHGPPNKKKVSSRSILKDAILRDILQSLPDGNASIYGTLSRKIEWIGGDAGSATVSLLKSDRILNRDTNKSIPTPQSFFVIDKTNHAELFKMHLTFFTKKWVSNVQPLPIFMSRSAWTIKENYLYSRLKSKLAQLYESGLYDRWEAFYVKDDIVYYIKKAAEQLDDRVVRNSSNGSGILSNPRNYRNKQLVGKQGGISLTNLFHYVYLNEQKESAFSGMLPAKCNFSNHRPGGRMKSQGISSFFYFLIATQSFQLVPYSAAFAPNIVNTFLDNFVGCHLRCYLGEVKWRDEITSGKLYRFLQKSFSGSVSFSIENSLTTNMTSYQFLSAHPFTRRYTKCLVQVHLIATYNNSIEESFLGNYDQPEFILFFTFGMELLNYQFFGGLRLQSILIEIYNFQHIFQIVSPLPTVAAKVYRYNSEEISNLDNIHSKWRKLNSNLHASSFTTLNVVLNFFPQYSTFKCNIYKKAYALLAPCMLFTLSEKFNISVFPVREKAFVTFSYLLQPKAMSLITQEKNLIPHTGFIENIFSFIVVKAEQPGKHLEAFLKPYNLLIWGLVLSTVTSISFALYFAHKLSGTAGLGLGKIWISTFGRLLEYSDETLSLPLFSTRVKVIFIVMLTVWSFCAMILGNLYKGALFSLLAKQSKFYVPDSLELLAESKLPIVTFTFLRDWQEGKIVSFSALRYLLKSMSESMNNYGIGSSSSIKNNKTYQDTMYKLVNPTFDNIAFFSSLVFNNEKLNAEYNLSYRYPSHFSMMDTSSRISLFKALNVLAGRWTSDNMRLPKIKTVGMWLIARFSFSQLFTSAFQNLYESGLYRRWEIYESQRDAENLMKDTVQRWINFPTILKSEGSEATLIRNMKQIQHNLLQNHETTISSLNQDSTAIPAMVLLKIFGCIASGYFVGLCSLFIELVRIRTNK
ncbi:unnamed protein product [Orchesella dallaii]|uniref:Uncharacterized protein n=1 Tax=Orchesella dallaii TaxID=48710 RepID=A0ABP1S477_9HEXA